MAINRSGCVLTGDWNRLRGFLKSGQEFVDGVNEVIQEEAENIRRAVQNEIPYRAVPNAPATVRAKGKNSPLLETGKLKSQGIVVNEYSSSSKGFKKYFVIQGDDGLLVDTRGRSGKDLLNYAQLLELMENGSGGTGKNGGVSIPPRPVLTITFNRYSKRLEREIIAKAFSKIHEALR